SVPPMSPSAMDAGGIGWGKPSVAKPSGTFTPRWRAAAPKYRAAFTAVRTVNARVTGSDRVEAGCIVMLLNVGLPSAVEDRLVLPTQLPGAPRRLTGHAGARQSKTSRTSLP